MKIDKVVQRLIDSVLELFRIVYLVESYINKLSRWVIKQILWVIWGNNEKVNLIEFTNVPIQKIDDSLDLSLKNMV